MDDVDITMEEYIQLMDDKARRHGQTFDWETATYGKVYCDDLDSFTDFETDFLAIVYNDASTSNQNISSIPTVSIYNVIKADIDFHISFSDFEDEYYTFIYNKDSSSYKLIHVNDLKSEPVNKHVEINTESCSENIDVKPMDSFICISKDTTLIEFDESIETNHDTSVITIKKDKGDILLVQVYVDDIIFGSTKKSLYDEFEGLMHKRFHMSSIEELTFFLASTPIETNKALVKDEEAEAVDVHLYRSMIGSLMYLTASKPDIMFAVCACTRFQVTPKTSHIHAVKRIFRYLKGQPKLGLWYPRDSPFDLEAFSDSDYARASLDRKSTTGGCQFLGRRLISWQCKKQTIVANSTTEAEYVAAANCYGQNLVFHTKTKHIEIRHHFIRDSYEKKLIQVINIHTDHNVADLLTKAFDVSSGPIHLVTDETVYKEWKDRMERAAITASSLEAEQDSGNINRTQSMATLNEPSP
ncbi:hypothetical protein Tco_1317787 [Tanacetum coccineum]